MPKVVGVRFGPATKIYYFDPAEFSDLKTGDLVIVDTARGRELGTVTSDPHDVPEEEIVGKLKPVLRRAEAWDLVQAESFKDKEREALEICKEKVAEQKLSMKPVRAEYSFDGSRLTFYFTAEKRVDFRALVRELAKTFRTRIELRQIGVRDEAKLIGGMGHCGRQLCCCTWLCDFSPVSIRMAKHQDLPLNPTEISGICGRLLCCLGYEDELYVEAKKRLPKVGRTITTSQGKGKVIGLNVFTETVKVQLDNEMVIEVSAQTLQERADGEIVQEAAPEEPIEAPAPEQTRPEREPEGRAARKRQSTTSSKPRRGRRRKKRGRQASSGAAGGKL